ncbi:MAG: terminase TerL endonuclease subunit [Methyloceanibacter sp.]|uniref:terminase TerL endonuclease subunit n=1 Tax=Methyloceanibacter sp. TaxID=1965321 RepID=UPI003D9B7B2E
MGSKTINARSLARWRRNPAKFIEEVLRDPETGKKFKLLDAEREFLKHAFKTDGKGRLLYPEQVYSCPKKSGKSAFNAMLVLIATLLFGGKFAEALCAANDLEQSMGRVFLAIKRIVEASPLLQREAKIVANKISFPATGAVITAISSDYAGAAGANPTISSFDELWGYTLERSNRLWDELVPPPTRKIACRLTTTYAGYTGESKLLEDLYARGLKQPQIGPDLYAGDGLLMFWSHTPVAPWQTQAWIEQMRAQLRPHAFTRMIENTFASGSESFVDMDDWDACCTGCPIVADADLPVWVAVDASFKRDTTAIMATTFDRETGKVRLVHHRIFVPTKGRPINFENDVEATLLDLKHRFRVREVRYDPWGMQSVAQRMTKAGLHMVEFPQSLPNVTSASQNLFELIKAQNLIAYRDKELRLAVSRAVAVENPRGWRIAKEKSSHKIDCVVALAMAALAAVQKGNLGRMRMGAIDFAKTGKVTWQPDRTHSRLRF